MLCASFRVHSNANVHDVDDKPNWISFAAQRRAPRQRFIQIYNLNLYILKSKESGDFNNHIQNFEESN